MLNSYPHYIALIFQKALADLISEARRGYMGVLWWLVEPMLYMSVFYVVFVIVFNRTGEDNVSFLLIGLVAWKWFAMSIPQCANCIAANIGLIRQVYIPKYVFLGMVITTNSLKFLIVFIILVIFLFFMGKTPSMAWLSIPLLMVTQLLMMLAIGGIVASITPFLPDLKVIIDNSMLLLFFLSGIFFDIASVSPEIKSYLYVNPMAGLIESYRIVLLDGVFPDWLFLGKVLFSSMVGIAFGWYFLYRFDRIYAKVL